MKTVLAVGGSDSGGGAGIQADLKTLQALGVHGSTVVTAVTAQSSTAVTDVHVVPLASVRAQLQAVLDDLGADVVKTGMVGAPETVGALLELIGDRPLVVDPVGTASTGRSLQGAEATAAVRDRLIPRATVVTPNLAEVAFLTGFVVRDEGDLLEAAKRVHGLGARWVLVKGGHLGGDAVDLLWDGAIALELRGPRLHTPHTHGTGCTLASALSAHLALGDDVPTSARKAKGFVARAITKGYPVGKGPGPVRQA